MTAHRTTIDAGIVIVASGDPTPILPDQITELFGSGPQTQLTFGAGLLHVTDVRAQLSADVNPARIEVKDLGDEPRVDLLVGRAHALFALLNRRNPHSVGINLQVEVPIGTPTGVAIATTFLNEALAGLFGNLTSGAVHFSYRFDDRATMNVQVEPRLRRPDAESVYINTNASFTLEPDATEEFTSQALNTIAGRGFAEGERVVVSIPRAMQGG